MHPAACAENWEEMKGVCFFQVNLPPGCLRLVKWNRSVRAELDSTDDNSVWLICASVLAIQHPQLHNQGISWLLTQITITSCDSQLLPLTSCAHSFLGLFLSILTPCPSQAWCCKVTSNKSLACRFSFCSNQTSFIGHLVSISVALCCGVPPKMSLVQNQAVFQFYFKHHICYDWLWFDLALLHFTEKLLKHLENIPKSPSFIYLLYFILDMLLNIWTNLRIIYLTAE